MKSFNATVSYMSGQSGLSLLLTWGSPKQCQPPVATSKASPLTPPRVQFQDSCGLRGKQGAFGPLQTASSCFLLGDQKLWKRILVSLYNIQPQDKPCYSWYHKPGWGACHSKTNKKWVNKEKNKNFSSAQETVGQSMLFEVSHGAWYIQGIEPGIQGILLTPSLYFPFECTMQSPQNPIPFLRAIITAVGKQSQLNPVDHIQIHRHESVSGDTWGKRGDQQEAEGARREQWGWSNYIIQVHESIIHSHYYI